MIAVLDAADDVSCMVVGELMPLYEKQFPGVFRKPGFNGGLFAVRTAEWRDLPERYEAAFDAGGYPYHPKIWDLPLLNGLMQPRVRFLPRAFNAN